MINILKPMHITITVCLHSSCFSLCICRVKEEAGFKKCPAEMARVEFVINTYAELQPFLEMAVLLLEGVYEHKMVHGPPSESPE